MVIPSFGAALDPAEIVAGLDGLLLTGSVSNVEPQHYGASVEPSCEPYDPARDATSLPLIGPALASGLPLLAVCRGFQELNVALGGTLNPRIHETEGRLDHRSRHGDSLDVQYAPVHEVTLAPGGLLQRLLGGETAIKVNSLHWQGIDRLAPGLAVEATAPDGTIEGIRVADAPGFTLGVQWHPEWQVAQSPVSLALFGAFGAAAQARHAQRR